MAVAVRTAALFTPFWVIKLTHVAETLTNPRDSWLCFSSNNNEFCAQIPSVSIGEYAVIGHRLQNPSLASEPDSVCERAPKRGKNKILVLRRGEQGSPGQSLFGHHGILHEDI